VRMSDVLECDKALERLPPRIGLPPVAECDSMACRTMPPTIKHSKWAKDQGQEPTNKMIAEGT
jgi:hypothetical protein